MERRLTIRDIAKALGCHFSTVSLALRNHPRLREETRLEIQEAARKMGYRPDPMVQALAAYRSSLKPAADGGVIAWLRNEKSVDGGYYSFWRYLEGARQRAAELGYTIEEFNLKAPGMTPHRMTHILKARGITGILVAPQPLGSLRARIRMDWTPFSAVTFGYTLLWPSLHTVVGDQFLNTTIAFRKLISLGYRRIGLCVERRIEFRSNGSSVAACLSQSSLWPPEYRIEPLVFETPSAAVYRKWYEANAPEVVIFQKAVEAEQFLDLLNLRTPEDIGVVSLSETSRPYAHMDQQNIELGKAASDLLVSMINNNERGIPSAPKRVTCLGIWRDGPSVSRRKTAAVRHREAPSPSPRSRSKASIR